MAGEINEGDRTIAGMEWMPSHEGPGVEMPSMLLDHIMEAARVPRRNGPLNKDELGRSTWNFLHTMAAYYPENASEETIEDCKNFLVILSKLYPCKMCADHFKELLKSHPPRVDGRRALSEWLCEVHNKVNKDIGKRDFDCKKTDKRWGGGGMTGGGTSAPRKGGGKKAGAHQ